MGLIIDPKISAIDLLTQEGIEINSIDKFKDIPKILIVNLMPNKTDTEYQLLKLLGNSFIDVEVDFLYTKTYKSKNVNVDYLKKAYITLDEARNLKYEGMIITGAPLEFVDFDDIEYWKELQEIMEFSTRNIKSTIYLCWATVAGLYYHYKIPKHIVQEKIAGIFRNKIIDSKFPLFKECGDELVSPHSRYFGIREEDIEKVKELRVLSKSKESGIHIVSRKDGRQIFITGHPEYGEFTLGKEYTRDLEKGLSPSLPRNYFPNDDINLEPKANWGRDSQKLIDNWIRYYLIQERGIKL